MLLLRSGAGLARMLLYGIFDAWELFYGASKALGYFAELAACKALANISRRPSAQITAALNSHTCVERPIRNLDSAVDTAAPSSRLAKPTPEFDP